MRNYLKHHRSKNSKDSDVRSDWFLAEEEIKAKYRIPLNQR